LRPDGIEWPVNEQGKATNRLELITKLNGIDHYAAHDALSDVHATIAVAKLVRDKQRKLFDYMFEHRTKKKIEEVVYAGQPFLYSSGKYPAETEKTSVVVRIADQKQHRGSYVYDLRHDPSEYLGLNARQLVDRWRYVRREDAESAPARLPVKLLQYNHCPAIAPLGVFDAPSQERLKLNLDTVQKHLKMLKAHPDFAVRILEAVDIMDAERDKAIANKVVPDVDGRLYDGFIGSDDKQAMRAIRVAQPSEIMNFEKNLRDGRLKELLPRYKARNYPESLSDEERKEWEDFCRSRLMNGGQSSQLAKFFTRLQELAAENPDSEKSYILEELQLYGQSIMPVYDDGSDE
jgi:exodeoxyribonuclease-1